MLRALALLGLHSRRAASPRRPLFFLAVRQVGKACVSRPRCPCCLRLQGSRGSSGSWSGTAVSRGFVCTSASSLITMSLDWCAPPSRSRKTAALVAQQPQLRATGRALASARPVLRQEEIVREVGASSGGQELRAAALVQFPVFGPAKHSEAGALFLR